MLVRQRCEDEARILTDHSRLNSACKQDRHDEAVPRGRVYSRYVDKCNNERIKILNPASFGKLVRIVFANIKTRRLGVRGQSKYNYCGLSLVEDKVNQRAVKPSAMTDGNFSGFAIPIHCNVDS